MKKRFNISNPLIRLSVSLIIIILSACLLSVFFYRIDLTSEKRYTLSKFSKKSLRNLKDVVVVKVYLDGDLNIPFRKMRQSLKETLDEFKVYAGNNLEYEFINPFAGKDARLKENMVNELYGKGLKPTIYLTGIKKEELPRDWFFPEPLSISGELKCRLTSSGTNRALR